jgi:hypothetical protein
MDAERNRPASPQNPTPAHDPHMEEMARAAIAAGPASRRPPRRSPAVRNEPPVLTHPQFVADVRERMEGYHRGPQSTSAMILA